MAVNFPKKAGEKNWMQVQLEEVRLQVNGLLANQRMEFICVSTLGAIAGAGIGWLVGILNGSMPPHNPATPLMASIKDCKPLVGALVGGSRVQSRNFAIMLGAHAAISNLTKEWGKLETSVVSGFGSGALFSLACDIGRPVSVVPNALASGILFGFVQGQISKMVSKSQHEALLIELR